MHSSVLTALVVLALLYFLGNPASDSVAHALPVLTIMMSIFVLNDISDAEIDRTNHPQRPIPSGAVSIRSAAIYYFVLLILSVVSIEYFATRSESYTYYLFLFLLSSYNLIVRRFPYLKNIYGAGASTFPLFVVDQALLSGGLPIGLFWSLIFFSFSREVLMDLRDLKGDGATLAKLIGERNSLILATVSQVAAVVALVLSATDNAQLVATALMAIVLVFSFWLWTRGRVKFALEMARVQYLLAVVFAVI